MGDADPEGMRKSHDVPGPRRDSRLRRWALAVGVLMPALLLGSRPAAGVDHAPIWIDGNANFTTANGVVGGTGTAGDPYLIAGWGFAISPWGRAIYIANTDAYVMIRGVTVSTTGTGGESYGVYLWNTTHVRVEDSAFVGLFHASNCA